MSRVERRTTPSAAFCVAINQAETIKAVVVLTVLYKDKQWLFIEYVDKDQSAQEIADQCGVSNQTILNWLSTHGIPRRQVGELSASTRKKQHPNNCTNCGKLFYVDMACKADPNNERKFARACSKECTSALKSRIMKRNHDNGLMVREVGNRRTFDRDMLIQLICYEYKYLGEVAKELGTKSTTLSREIKRLNVPTNEFYRICPQCNEQFTCTMRCQVDPTSNKFKKFCSHACFLKSRNNTDTWIERVTAEYLTDNHIEFIPQYSIGRMTADFYIPSINLVVETNGDFWHANPSIYTDESELHPIQRRAIEKDKRKLRQLREKGYDVFILWENDLKHKKDEVLDALLTYVQSKETV